MPLSKDFFEKLYNRNSRIISRAISYIENENDVAGKLLEDIYTKTGNAYRIGITGPPGAGKSTITNQLTKYYRSQGNTVGIIAIDPTSPFTGGALLGDRVRMNDIGTDDGVFIRSMATRGSLGGLSKKAIDTADILDASGFDYIIFETVGVGQSELDIAKVADTTLVVLVPESGDAIQAMKAGLMEIADCFIMNKSDRPGADSAIMALQAMIHLRADYSEFENTIIKSIASENKGINDIAEIIKKHFNYLNNSNLLKQNRELHSKIRIINIVEDTLKREVWNSERENKLTGMIEQVVDRKISPYSLAEEIIINYKSEVNNI